MSAAPGSAGPERGAAQPLLRVEGLVKHFPVTAGVIGRTVAAVKAVDGIDFELQRGRTLGLVGESGCGKSTVGRCVLRLEQPTAGHVYFEGRDLTVMSQYELRSVRRELQIVFQDPFSSLNPRMTVADIVGEGIRVHGLASGREAEERIVSTLAKVGIPQAWINRYPHEFSGGQRQRISIARAIAVEPKLVVCDEAVSALDVSIQAQVLNLLVDLRRDLGLAYLFISHDLSVVRHVSDDVAVMYLGQLVERAPAAALFERPAHPYTRALLSAIPVPDPTRQSHRTVLEGDVPTPLDPPPGCRFHTRCPAAIERCSAAMPPDVDLGGGHRVACVHAEGLAGQGIDAQRVLDERIAAAEAVRASARSALRNAAAPGERFGGPHSEAAAGGAAGGGEGGRPAASAGLAPPREASGQGTRLPASGPPQAPGSPRALQRPGSPDGGGAERESGAPIALGALLQAAWPPSLETLGIASAGLACLLAVAQWIWIPILLGLTSFGLFAASLAGRDDGRTLLRGLGIAGALFLSMFVGRALGQAREFQRADRQLAALHQEIERFEAVHGRLPVSLAELGWRIAAAVDGEARDPWGQRWRYVQPGKEGRAYELGSVGPDGVLGSQDDVGELGAPPGLRLSPPIAPAEGSRGGSSDVSGERASGSQVRMGEAPGGGAAA